MFRGHCGVSIVISIVLACSSSAASAQSNTIENQVAGALRGKILTLKTFSKSGHVDFDATGQIKNKGESGPWTIYSQLIVNKVELSDTRLRIDGFRVVHRLDDGSRKLVPSRSDMNVDVDIDVPKGASVADLNVAISRVFAGAEGLVPYVPEYWRPYLENKPESPRCDPPTTTVRVGGNVLAANLVKNAPPRYPSEAKNFHLRGLVVLAVLINESGEVGRVTIVEPAGAEMDENAVEAVSQWKYKPTTMQGKPVCVVTTVTVNYELTQ